MAEKATAGNALAFTLTYKNLPSGDSPLGARTFVYRDFVLFKKAVAEAYYRKYKARGEFSWVVCGEMGSKKGRVHWHAVLFSKKPLGDLGKWTNYHTGEKYDEMPLEKRCAWSLWKKGLVQVQQPDAGGMAYVLVYGMKDQFGVKKARGNKRETKAENYAAGKFRMSKHPPIGVRYLATLADLWRNERRVPPTLQIKVQDYNGYWWPKGKIREWLLSRCWEINEQIKKETGRDAPQWSSLLASVSQYEKDEEILNHGEKQRPTEEEERSEVEHFEEIIDGRRVSEEAHAQSYKVVARCGGVRPCETCWITRQPDQQAELDREYEHWFALWDQKRNTYNEEGERKYGENNYYIFNQWWAQLGRCSRGCYFRDEPQTKADFASYKRRRRARRKYGR